MPAWTQVVDSLVKMYQEKTLIYFVLHSGIVTTARITHATPAAMYAHSFDRHFESDGDYPMQPDTPPENVTDIAFQLVNHAPGNRAKVLLGGGASAFYPEEKQEEMRGKSVKDRVWDYSVLSN